MGANQSAVRVGTTWGPYEPTAAMPWDLRRAVHLYRRAAFAASWSELQRSLAESPQRAIDRLLQGESREEDAVDFESLARVIGDAASASGSPGRLKAWWLYPATQLASQLKLVSKLLKSGSEARIFYTVQSGYDTHSSQLDTHSQRLREFSDAVRSFLEDLRLAKLDDRVLVLAFSEFGRRVKENASQGTDHGTAGPVFLAGGRVRRGVIGKHPSRKRDRFAS
ncbi:MAG: DUF1501 domain-containing protein [Pirellulaceae bacterium]